MKNIIKSAVMAATVATSMLAVTPAASAQSWREDRREANRDYREARRDWRQDRREGREWRDDRREARRDWRNDRRDWRSDRRDARRDWRWRNYGGRYGYDGYNGRWRTGQRYSYWNNSRYYVNDWGYYNLPAPRRGYRYYRDDSGDIIMAAIGTGIIAAILASN